MHIYNHDSSFSVQGQTGDVKSYVYLVGQEFYYTLYDVMVQPFNDAGAGPNSTVATIYSAEDSEYNSSPFTSNAMAISYYFRSLGRLMVSERCHRSSHQAMTAKEVCHLLSKNKYLSMLKWLLTSLMYEVKRN